MKNNKQLSALGYLVFFLPYFGADKNDPHVRYHFRQSVGLLIAALSLQGILSIWGFWGLPLKIFLMWLIRFVLLYLALVGIRNALKGAMEPLPVIGKHSAKL